jgi:putative FmdB family regulatory protein
MPIYEYKCKDCGAVSEFLVNVGKEKPDISCSHCGSRELEKLFSESYMISSASYENRRAGRTCCGRDERCDTPPCSDGGICQR